MWEGQETTILVVLIVSAAVSTGGRHIPVVYVQYNYHDLYDTKKGLCDKAKANCNKTIRDPQFRSLEVVNLLLFQLMANRRLKTCSSFYSMLVI